MKIALGQIGFNPHRDMGNYPIDKERKEKLRKSIRDTGFWDNILVRPNPNNSGGYQLAYGHHRLEVALEELGSDYLADIPVKELPSGLMLEIMIQENETISEHSPTVLREDYAATKRYFEEDPEGQAEYKELQKEWDQFSRTDRPPGGNKERWVYSRKMGIPVTRVQEAISLWKDANPELEAVATSTRQATTIKRKVKEPDLQVRVAKVTEAVEEAEEIAEELKKVEAPEEKERVLAAAEKAKEKGSKTSERVEAAKKARISIEDEKAKVSQEAAEVKKRREVRDGNAFLKQYGKYLFEINIGLTDLLPVWDELDEEQTSYFFRQMTRIVEKLTKHFKPNQGETPKWLLPGI